MNRKQSEIIKDISDKELSFHLYLTQVILLVISTIIGIFIIKDWTSFLNQFQFTPSIFTVGLCSGFVVVLLDLLLMRVVPKRYYDDGGVNERIFKNRSVPSIVLLSAMIAVSEELLFRGILQYHFGIIIASIIFAIIHFRYWAHWFLIINVMVLSFVIGAIYHWTENIWVTIMMHFIIDCFLGIYIKYTQKNL